MPQTSRLSMSCSLAMFPALSLACAYACSCSLVPCLVLFGFLSTFLPCWPCPLSAILFLTARLCLVGVSALKGGYCHGLGQYYVPCLVPLPCLLLCLLFWFHALLPCHASCLVSCPCFLVALSCMSSHSPRLPVACLEAHAAAPS